MIHYHGTPCGGKRIEAARFLMGRHALVPYPRPEDLATVMEVCRSFVVDNGAFTVWKQGGTLDVAGYQKWVESIYRHPGFDWALIPDVIDGTEMENDAMLDDWPKHLPGVPVYHLHESLERAALLANDFDTVAIGSSGEWPVPGERKWRKRMADVMGAMCDHDGVPRCKIHGLRMMDPDIFKDYPFRSVDSTNCAQNGARNGKLIDERLTSGQGAIITAWRIEAYNSPAIWRPDASSLANDRCLF